MQSSEAQQIQLFVPLNEPILSHFLTNDLSLCHMKMSFKQAQKRPRNGQKAQDALRLV